jgi:hypothetical protein
MSNGINDFLKNKNINTSGNDFWEGILIVLNAGASFTGKIIAFLGIVLLAISTVTALGMIFPPAHALHLLHPVYIKELIKNINQVIETRSLTYAETAKIRTTIKVLEGLMDVKKVKEAISVIIGLEKNYKYKY